MVLILYSTIMWPLKLLSSILQGHGITMTLVCILYRTPVVFLTFLQQLVEKNTIRFLSYLLIFALYFVLFIINICFS